MKKSENKTPRNRRIHFDFVLLSFSAKINPKKTKATAPCRVNSNKPYYGFYLKNWFSLRTETLITNYGSNCRLFRICQYHKRTCRDYIKFKASD